MTPEQQHMELVRDAAHAYLELGWSIIPVLAIGSAKVPAIKWTEYQTKAATEEEVNAWFDDGVPDGEGGLTKFFNLGLVTGAISGLVVLDCDNQEALTCALAEYSLFSVLGVKTTRGQHIYFRHPGNGERIMNKAGGVGRDWPDVGGLDLRGDGGYVVLPPSVKFADDGSVKHSYSWTVPRGELDDALFSLAVWPGIKAKARSEVPLQDGEWSFENLRLDAVRTYGGSVWDEAVARVKKLGRKMIDGDGRNPWLTRYLGECVGSGMMEEQAKVAAEQFALEFFDQPLPDREVATVLGSVIGIDKRNHPEKYEPAPGYKNQTPERAKRHAALRLITPASLAELKKLAEGQQYLLDPYIPPQAIIQMVGFNGHGKSFVTQNMLYAAALGKDFGPATVLAPVRTLYLDFENSGQTLSLRLSDCETLHGPMSDRFTVWGKSVTPDEFNLADEVGLAKLAEFLKEVKPQVVVIDTVREAWLGMEENSPHAWVKVNHAALTMRNAGMSVILLHHRNKPNQTGIGREAGSTAQLKDLDVQVFITKVEESEEQARREASISDCNTQIVDFTGRVHTAWSYLRASLPPGFVLKTVFELTFGKLRSKTENHVNAYIGIANEITTGRSMVVSTKTPRQKAAALANKKTEAEIAEALQVPLPTIQRWARESRQKNVGDGAASQATGN